MGRFNINSIDTLNQFLQLEEAERARLTEVSFDLMEDWFPSLRSIDTQKFRAFCNSLLQCSGLQTISDSEHEGKSALWLAAYYEQWALIDILLEYARQGKYRLDINLSPVEGPHQGTTALWWSVYPGSKEIVELLLLNRADINAIPIEGQHKWETPLWRAAQHQCWDIVKLMIEHAEQKNLYINFNASPRESDDTGITPLWWAAYDKQWDLVTLMLTHVAHKGYHPNFDTGPTEGEHKGKTVFSLMSACVDELDLEPLLLILNKTPKNSHELNVTIDPAKVLKSFQDNDDSKKFLPLLNPKEEGKKLLPGFELKKYTAKKDKAADPQPTLQKARKKGPKPILNKTPKNSHELNVTVDPAKALKSFQDNDDSKKFLLLLNPKEEGKKLLPGFELKKYTAKDKAADPQPTLQKARKKGRKPRYTQRVSMPVSVVV